MDDLHIITNDEDKLAQALAGLYNVYDPEIGLNIVDLGLLYELHFDEEGKKLLCIMTLTSQFCPMGEAITTDTNSSLNSSFPEWGIQVDLTFDPPWSADKITPTGREYLGQ